MLQCLAKEPSGRPASATALRDALLACEDASRYDRAAAMAWWHEYASEVHAGAALGTPRSPATMAVDLRGRSVAQSALAAEL